MGSTKKNKPKTEKNEIISINPEEYVVDLTGFETKIEELSQKTEELDSLREKMSIDAKFKDLEYVESIDSFISAVLGAMAEIKNDPRALKTAVKTMIANGQFTKLRDLFTALGIAVDKRNEMLGYDSSRQQAGKRKLKLQVLWKGSTGDGAAIQAETTDE